MRPNTKALKKLIDEKFNGNKAAFAREIGVERAQVSKIVRYGTYAGAKFYGALIAYCERNGLDYRDYIIIKQDTSA